MKLTAEQVEQAILDETGNYAWNNLGWDIKNSLVVDGESYEFEVVDTQNDGEWGYETYVVMRVGNQYFRKSGYYESHYGNDWDGDFEEVEEAEKKVTVWRTV